MQTLLKKRIIKLIQYESEIRIVASLINDIKKCNAKNVNQKVNKRFDTIKNNLKKQDA